MFVQSEKFVEAHGGKFGDIAIYGQESNSTSRRLALMNLALRHVETDLRAAYVLANPPFNDSDWFRKDDDVRWQYGVPPDGNANFAASKPTAACCSINPAKATSAGPSSRPISSVV